MTEKERREQRITVLKMSIDIAKTEYSACNTNPKRVLEIAAQLEKWVIDFNKPA